jgi:predicted RND superfamily exporter protein
VGLYTDGTVPTRTVAAETRTTAVMVEDGHDSLSATATGQPVIRADVQERLFSTVLRSFALTLLVVLGILVGIFRWTRNTASLGIVVIVPVLCAVAWILGTMAFLGLPFNILTALITSFTVGIGVDYAIHLAERYVQEAERLGAGPAALRTAVHGTGGAILGSALTTAVGFGVLVFALLEPLRQFGAIVALSIGYAFLGSVIVLPSLLVLWTRHVADPVPEAHCE